MELAQAPGNATVTGTYTGEHFVGSINGQTTSNAFTGTIDLSFDLDGMACTGSANLSGTASTSALNWTSASLAGASPCIDAPVDFALNAQR